jgi:hypothetical protein
MLATETMMTIASPTLASPTMPQPSNTTRDRCQTTVAPLIPGSGEGSVLTYNRCSPFHRLLGRNTPKWGVRDDV